MLGAIVGFSDQRQLFFAHRRALVQEMQLPIGDAACLLFLLPCTAEDFEKLPAGVQNRMLSRLVRAVEKSGAGCVYAVRQLRERIAGNFYIPDGRRIFCALAGQIIERHCQTFSLAPASTCVCIYENPFSAAGAAAAQFMAMHTKQLFLISPDVKGAVQVSATLFDEYGLAVKAVQNEKLLNKADIALLLSAPPGEVLSTGLVLDFSGQYPYRARRDTYFEPAFGFAPFFRYFDRADCRGAEFMLLCCGCDMADVPAALEAIGWKQKRT